MKKKLLLLITLLMGAQAPLMHGMSGILETIHRATKPDMKAHLHLAPGEVHELLIQGRRYEIRHANPRDNINHNYHIPRTEAAGYTWHNLRNDIQEYQNTKPEAERYPATFTFQVEENVSLSAFWKKHLFFGSFASIVGSAAGSLAALLTKNKTHIKEGFVAGTLLAACCAIPYLLSTNMAPGVHGPFTATKVPDQPATRAMRTAQEKSSDSR
jgi:hypothetical protein